MLTCLLIHLRGYVKEEIRLVRLVDKDPVALEFIFIFTDRSEWLIIHYCLIFISFDIL